MTLLLLALLAQRGEAPPKPDHAGVAYGTHERHVLDLWLAKSDKRTPLVIFIHGGGFRAGSKDQVSPNLIRQMRDAGISVASINYRLTDAAKAPAQMMDAARAVQFLRAHANDYNLNPERFGATGGSAGAGISLWLAFHDDLADPKSQDPVARESTRLTCAAVTNGQTSYDPLWIKEHIGGEAWLHPALQQLFGLAPEEFEKGQKQFDEISPIAHLDKGDVPTHLTYAGRKDGDIHSARFGEILKEKMDALKLECAVVIREGKRAEGETTEAFLIRQLTK